MSYFIASCLFSLFLGQELNAQTYLKNFTPFLNATTSDVEFDVMTEGANNTFWVAGALKDNTGNGIVIAQTPRNGAIGVVLNTSRVYISGGLRYVPTDIIEATASGGTTIIVTCLAYNGTTLVGGAIVCVDNFISTLWIREFTGTTNFRPYNIIKTGGFSNPLFYVCGETRGSGSFSCILSVTQAGVVTPLSNYGNNISSETFMGLLDGITVSAQKRLLLTGRTSIGTANMKPFTASIPMSQLTGGFAANLNHYRGLNTSRMYGEDIISATLPNLTQGIAVAGEGHATSATAPNFRPFMYVTDANGALTLFSTYDISNYPSASVLNILNVRQVNNRYYLLGTSSSTPESSFMICTDTWGTVIWAQEYPLKVQPNSDAFFTDGTELFFVGYVIDDVTGHRVPRMINTDLDGKIVGGGCVTQLNCVRTSLNESANPLVLTQNTNFAAQTTPTISSLGFEIYSNLVCGNSLRFAKNIDEPTTHFSCFPNPANDHLNITIPSELGMNTLKIFNLSGQILMTKELDSEVKELELDINSLPNGILILRLEGTSSPQIQKFVKE